jgi:hypothetical protein
MAAVRSGGAAQLRSLGCARNLTLHAPSSDVRWRARLRGAMSAAVRVVAHIDLDAFYVQCEAQATRSQLVLCACADAALPGAPRPNLARPARGRHPVQSGALRAAPDERRQRR